MNPSVNAFGEPAWLLPVSAAQPCGPSVEYDPEYVVLSSRLRSRDEVQYGNYVDRPEGPDWAEIERDCRRLLCRSQDISVLVWLARCRTRSAGSRGLAEGLLRLAEVLQRYPDDVHPQIEIEGVSDPAVRANALANLVDSEGFLGDVRDVLISSHSAARLTIRDVERALSVPPIADGLKPEAVLEQLAHLREQGSSELERLSACHEALQRIDAWGKLTLGEWAPALDALHRVLSPFGVNQSLQTDAGASKSEEIEISGESAMSSDAQLSGRPAVVDFRMQREQVRTVIRQAKEWLEHHEPSSPVVILLKQAERLLGKRYAEVVQAIPADLLARWDVDE